MSLGGVEIQRAIITNKPRVVSVTLRFNFSYGFYISLDHKSLFYLIF